MAKLIEHGPGEPAVAYHFDRPGMVRVAVRIETHRDTYVHNLMYGDSPEALAAVEKDVEALLAVAQLAADCQDELDREAHQKTRQHAGMDIVPVARHVRIDHVDHRQDRKEHVLRLMLEDEIVDPQHGFHIRLPRGDRRSAVCHRGCEYKGATATGIKFYVARLRKHSQRRAESIAAKKALALKS